MLPTRRGPNPQPPDHQSDTHSTELLEKKIFKSFYHVDMAAILFNGAEPFEEIGNTLSAKGPLWNLVKIAQAISEKKTFKNYTILYMCIAQRQGQITLRDKIFIITNFLHYFNHTF